MVLSQVNSFSASIFVDLTRKVSLPCGITLKVTFQYLIDPCTRTVDDILDVTVETIEVGGVVHDTTHYTDFVTLQSHLNHVFQIDLANLMKIAAESSRKEALEAFDRLIAASLLGKK